MGNWNWLDWAMGLIYGGVPWGRAARAGSGRLDRFMGMPHWGARLDRGDGIDWWGCAMGRVTLAGSGRWDWFMGAHDIGWIGAMGLIHGGTPWGHATLAGLGWWDWVIRGAPWGRATLAGSGRWVWLMGARNTGWTGAMGSIYGGAQHWLEQGDGIDLWGSVMEAPDWIGEMGLICGGTPWGCDTGWMWAMGLSYGGVLWGHATGSGWWNWFVEESHGGHWLDPGDGIDLCGRVMGACDTGWIGAMGLIHGGVPNVQVIWFLNLNDDTICPHVWCWGKCAEWVWLRGWWMQIDGLVRGGQRSISGITGLCPSRSKPSMGQSRWGFMC